MSQTTQKRRNQKQRDARLRRACEFSLATVHISAVERAMVDDRMVPIREPEAAVVRQAVVLLSTELRRAVDERLQPEILDGSQSSPLVRMTPLVISQEIPGIRSPTLPLPPPLPMFPIPAPPPPRQVAAPRRRHAAVPRRQTYKCAVIGGNVEGIQTFYCGSAQDQHRMTLKCSYCLAEFFAKECRREDGRYYLCCNFGKVNVPLLQECPQELKALYTEDGNRNVLFRNNIRAANSLFAMASFKANVPTDRVTGQGHWCFQICGQIYHYTEPIPAHDGGAYGGNLQYNQYYFVDANEAIQRRSTSFGRHIDEATIRTLEVMLRRENPLVRLYMSMAEVVAQRQRLHDLSTMTNPTEISIAFSSRANHQRRGAQDLPTGNNEVAAVYDGEEPPRDVDLVVYDRQHHGHSTEIKNLNPLADPMVYPLLFPGGEDGYRTLVRYVGQPRTLHQRRGRIEQFVIDDRYDHGDMGQDAELPEVDDARDETHARPDRRRRTYVTMRQFYRHRIMIRRPSHDFDEEGAPAQEMFVPATFAAMHNGGKLFQQYIVDAWVRIEANNLWFLSQNQQMLRKTNVAALRRHLVERAASENARLGKIVILPRVFLTGHRHINRLYLDAMTTVARHGCPSLFLTFTCNPRWPEITQNLDHKQKFEHRPDLVVRVFHTKLLEFIDDLYVKQFFGVPLNYMYVVEFQKRGLPHAHVLLTLRPEDRPQTEQDIDSTIQAEFPDPREEPRLFHLVERHMLHGPCGIYKPAAPCMKDGVCKKYYPKAFRERTDTIGDDRRLNQPEYRRPNNNRGVQVRDIFVDNTWVVPYNKFLLAKYDCHINVECCGSVKTIKYLHKYVSKGPDYCQIMQAQTNNLEGGQRTLNWDEIQHYKDHRYVSSMEAAWRLMDFPLSDRSHSVTALPVHLPGEMTVMIGEDVNPDEALQRAAGRRSKLEAWFSLNAERPDARIYKYQEIPEHFTWETRHCTWQPRRKTSRTLGCLIEVSPEAGDVFYLRMILSHVRGALSFEELRSVNGTIYQTYLDACRARNLLQRSDEYERCLQEAARTKTPKRLRALFALVACEMRNNNVDIEYIAHLWRVFRIEMTTDFCEDGNSPNMANLKALLDIERTVHRSSLGGDEVNLPQLGLPEVPLDASALEDNFNEVFNLSQTNSVPPVVGDDSHDQTSALNHGQKTIFDEVIRAVQTYIGKGPLTGGNMFFVDGPGGCGKTFLYNTIINHVMDVLRKTCLPVAWTGIAATLLRGGKTVHSTFRLPLTLDEGTVAGFPLDSPKTEEIRTSVAVLWDEAPMTPKRAVQAVDRFLRAVMDAPAVPFGGKVVLFGGDFRQLLPVMPRAFPGQLIDASIQRWAFWRQVAVRRLSENVRVQQSVAGNGAGNTAYANLLLAIGNGTAKRVSLPDRPTVKNLVQLPQEVIVDSPEKLIDFVYGEAPLSADQLTASAAGLAILCPTNAAVDKVNSLVLDRLAGDARTYFSVDKYMGSEDDDVHVPDDLLHAVNIPSIGPHELKLKVGAVMMLVRNIDLTQGLCNGTRLQLVSLGNHMLEAKVLTGEVDGRDGKTVFLPRMNITASPTSGTHIPGKMKRLQFPVRLAFAVTINKSQGQTFRKVGVHLNTPCFTHGQLYVALSRVGSPRSIKIYVQDSALQGSFTYAKRKKFTPNIVFADIVSGSLHVEDTTRVPNPTGQPSEHPFCSQVPNPQLMTEASLLSRVSLDLTQFYLDDWSQELLVEIDRFLASRSETTAQAAESQEDLMPEGFLYFSPAMDVDAPSAPTSNTRPTKGKRLLPRQQTATVDVSTAKRPKNRPGAVLKEDPRMPHILAEPRISIGDKAGTSGLHSRSRIDYWEIISTSPVSPQSDSD